MPELPHRLAFANNFLPSLVWASCFVPFLVLAEPYQPDGDGQVVMETEHYDLNVSQGGRDWADDFTPGFVGDGAMQSVPNSFFKVTSNLSSNSPRMDYEVEYAAPVTLNVWVRGLGLSGSRDSIWVGVDGNDATAQVASLTRSSYGWTKSGQISLSAGVHTINVWMREDGSIVDRVLLTPLSTVPTGDGPAESTRGGGVPGNTPPEAFDDSLTVDEDSTDNALAVLADNGGGGPDSDPDGDPVTIVSTENPGSANGTVLINGTSDGLIYTPAADFAGAESFDYTIGDGLGGFSTATVTVTVNNSNNDSPVLAPVGPRTATEEQSLSFSVSASDVDGAPLPIMSADLSQLPGLPSFVDNDDGTGSFSWTPTVGDAPGPYSVTFTATDAVDSALTSAEVISIDVQTAGSGGGSGAYQADGSGQFVMEAENFDSNVSQGGRDWVDDFTPGYVGDGAMQSVPDSFTKFTSNLNANSPRLDYQVELAAPATLNVWIRGLGLSGSRDSIWIGADGNDGAAQVVSLSRGSYGWTTSGQISLSAGVHTINVWMREDGAIVDRILLTPLSTVPTGDGPAESTRGGGGPPVNVAPVLATIGNRSATESQTLSFDVSASDAVIPIMSADLSQLPGLPSFVDNDDGTGSFSWTPTVGDAPGPYSVTFTATDAVDSALTSAEVISIDVQTAGSGGGSGAYQADGSGQFVMEAENFDSNVSQGGRDWVDDFTPGYVGDGAMQSVPDSFTKFTSNLNANSPRLDYQVELAAPATLNVWIRGLGLSGSRDSIWIGADGNDGAAQVVSLSRGSYGWTTSGQISLSAGVHTINVWMREDGAIVDRILLTPLSTVPTGDGPAESTRGGGGPPVNVAPVLATIGNRSATESQTLSFDVSASDAVIPIMSADLSQLPGTPSFTDNNNGTGTFSWSPPAGAAPGPYSVTFTATDAVDSALTSAEVISIDVQTAGSGGGSGAYQADGSGQFVMEAEHFDSNVSQGGRDWVDDFTPGYVGNGAMQSVPDSFTKFTSNLNANSPRLDYQVELAAPATLNVWIRGLGLSGSRDSIWIGADGNDGAAQVVSLSRGSYGWTTSGQISLSAGVHTINVWMREDGSIVDRILLTPLSTTLSGDGPPESTRGAGGSTLPLTDDFSDGDAVGWTITDDATQFPSNWNVAGQSFVQSAWTNSSGKDVTETYHRGSYAYWTQSAGLSNYRLSVDVLPDAESGDDIGVMFRYMDSSHYYRFSLNVLNGFARLESNLNGTYLTLASDHRGYVPGELQQIVVEAEGPLIQVFVNGDPLFAVSSTHHTSGGIALFSRDASTFDNVTLDANSSAPEIVISRPVAHNVLPGAPLDLDVAAVARNVPAIDGSVLFQYGSGGSPTLCDTAVEGPSGVFSAQCAGVPAGEYTIDAILLNGGVEVDRDTNVSVAIGGGLTGSHRYDAIGNSITRGVGDNYAFDTLNLDDQRTRSISGWPALLGDILTTSSGVPNLVGNEGISGDRANETRDQRLFSIIERNPESDRALVTLGTNDSNNFNTTSTTDLTAALQNIIDTLHANGRDTVYLSLLPPAWGQNNSTGPYLDPLAVSATRNQTVISYNTAIQGMLPQAGVSLGPDFFSCFLTPTVNRFSLFEDNLHPNALGYVFMAELWNQAITSGPVVPPVDPCASPIYILESLDPYAHGHKQNLLEKGDEYYTDSSFALTNVPPELRDGIWVMQANADNANADADFLSFDAGSTPVTVYIAYDPAGAPPTSSTHTFTPATLSESLTVSDGSVGTFGIVRAASVTGNVTIGGNKSGLAPAAQQGYVVIVVK